MQILDGGLATALESSGHDLNDNLWSARLLTEQPSEILAVHRAFLEAGADIITTASYQATIPGLMRSGMSELAAEDTLRQSVRLAKTACENSPAKVAASIGPYGAFLANGAEYTGDYDVDRAGLIDFHRQRWQVIVEEQPDILLCETIPSLTEASVLGELAGATESIPVWISFSCRNDRQICDGTEIEACVKALDSNPSISGIGINCTPPRFVPELIRRVRCHTDKTAVVFPNSGETWDASTKTWIGDSKVADFAAQSELWRDLGANVIGGCCRVTPAHIRQLRERLG